LKETKLSQIFGVNFESRLSGYSKSINSDNRILIKKTSFPQETNLLAIFIREPDGTIKLKTMYPDF
jgi:hypothetical protein